MEFHAYGKKGKPVIIVLHGMALNYESNLFFTMYLQKDYRIILPTFDGMCPRTTFKSKANEAHRILRFLKKQGIHEIELLVGSSIGADIGLEFLRQNTIPINHILFDSASIWKKTWFIRKRMAVPMYAKIRNIQKGKEDIHGIYPGAPDEMTGIFYRASINLKRKSVNNILKTCMTKKPRPELDNELQKKIVFLYGTKDPYYSCRKALISKYPYSHYPILEGWYHMEYQMRKPKSYAELLRSLIEKNALTEDVRKRQLRK